MGRFEVVHSDCAHPKHEGSGQSHPQQPLGGSSDVPLIAYAVFICLSQTPGIGEWGGTQEARVSPQSPPS